MAIQTRGRMPPKNMATAISGKNDAAVPKSGWMMISPTGRPMMAMAIMNERKSR
jgi:hypothetical protein